MALQFSAVGGQLTPSLKQTSSKGQPLLDLKDKTAVVIGVTQRHWVGPQPRAGVNSSQFGSYGTSREAQVRTAVSAVEALGRRSLAATCDVTDNSNLENFLQLVCNAFGSIDILVNCAGRTKRMSTLEVPEADWDAILESKLTDTFRACCVFGRAT
jgi:NAD(P)-dependent dehydrogenase (short-subunit alcohol dehydrogenase family)